MVAKLKAVESAPRERTPEREALAEAIQKRDKAQQRVDAINTALEQIESDVRVSQNAVEDSMAAIATAKSAHAKYLTERALGRATTRPRTVAEHRADHEAAKIALADARDSEEELQADLNAAQNVLELAKSTVMNALVAVVSSSPEVLALVNRYQNAAREAKRAAAALDRLKAGGPRFLPKAVSRWREEIEEQYFEDLAEEWRTAVNALHTNADAALPD
jgi:predicted KAP-like P-loop ATPase